MTGAGSSGVLGQYMHANGAFHGSRLGGSRGARGNPAPGVGSASVGRGNARAYPPPRQNLAGTARARLLRGSAQEGRGDIVQPESFAGSSHLMSYRESPSPGLEAQPPGGELPRQAAREVGLNRGGADFPGRRMVPGAGRRTCTPPEAACLGSRTRRRSVFRSAGEWACGEEARREGRWRPSARTARPGERRAGRDGHRADARLAANDRAGRCRAFSGARRELGLRLPAQPRLTSARPARMRWSP